MSTTQLSRHAIRALVEDHARRQFAAEGDGRWHATQNDLNDELAQHRAEVAERAGEIEAERFMRIYAEEVLAYERDFHMSPRKGAVRMGAGSRVQADKSYHWERPHPPAVVFPEIEAPKRESAAPGWIFVLIAVSGAAALLF